MRLLRLIVTSLDADITKNEEVRMIWNRFARSIQPAGSVAGYWQSMRDLQAVPGSIWSFGKRRCAVTREGGLYTKTPRVRNNNNPQTADLAALLRGAMADAKL